MATEFPRSVSENPWATLPRGWTPLMKAAWTGDLSAAEALLRAGADATVPNQDLATPLHLACRRGHLGVAALLLAYTAASVTSETEMYAAIPASPERATLKSVSFKAPSGVGGAGAALEAFGKAVAGEDQPRGVRRARLQAAQVLHSIGEDASGETPISLLSPEDCNRLVGSAAQILSHLLASRASRAPRGSITRSTRSRSDPGAPPTGLIAPSDLLLAAEDPKDSESPSRRRRFFDPKDPPYPLVSRISSDTTAAPPTSKPLDDIPPLTPNVPSPTHSKRLKSPRVSPAAVAAERANKAVEETVPKGPYVFLGGACNPTTWRREQAIPMLEAARVAYFNPQTDEWFPELVEVEARAKRDATAHLFVVNGETRGVASLVEVAELSVRKPRQLVVVLEDVEEGVSMGDEVLGPQQVRDLNRGRAYLTDLLRRQGVPIFTTVPAAVPEVVKRIRKPK